jgi:nitrate reductase gamma subunit
METQSMSAFLRLLENEVQIAALAFLTLVYILRLVWLFRFRSAPEKTYAAGNAGKGIALSMLNVAMPWAMESTRKKPFFYVQFVIFHIGVTLAIAATFIIPYWPRLFTITPVVVGFQIALAAAFAVGLLRLYRRLTTPALRLISTVDDYLSLVLMILFFLAGVFAVPNRVDTGEWALISFFALTAFFLIYVPFSKICHYLYYPFTRFFFGRMQGHRGVVAKHRRVDL